MACGIWVYSSQLGVPRRYFGNLTLLVLAFFLGYKFTKCVPALDEENRRDLIYFSPTWPEHT